MSNFIQIRCYLQFDPYNYFLCIILDYKNLKYKLLIDHITINFLSSESFASIEYIRRKRNPIDDLSKFTFNKKILNKVVVLGYNQVYSQTLYF